MGLKTWEMKIADRTFKFKMKKDSAEAVARRIRDAVALRQFVRELGTYGSGEDYSSTSMVLFGLSGTPIKDEAVWQADLTAALDKYAGIVIMDRPEAPNAGTCLGDFVKIFEKHIPVKDSRKHAAELAAEKQERDDREAERKATEKAAAAEHLAQFGIDPETAAPLEFTTDQMAIVLRTTFDNSDSMSDYYDPHSSVGVPLVLAIVKRQAQTQALARMAVGRYPELAGIELEWKTETYRGGHGNYLYSPYLIDITDHYAKGAVRRCRYEIQFQTYRQSDLYPYKGFPGNASQSAQAEAAAPVSNAAATIARNTAKDGIEIRFSERPADSIISRLKANRWRWSRFSKCWYTRYSTQAESFAAEIVKSLQPEAEAPPAEAISIPPAEVSADLAAEVFENSPAEEDEETLTAEDMSAITGQEWTEEAMEQFRACC